MATRYRSEPGQDAAAAFRARVGRLGRPDRRHNEALRVRVNLARASRVGLRERLGRSELPRSVSA